MKKNSPHRVKGKIQKDPFKGKFTKLSAIPGTTIIPNKVGTDLYSKDDSFDAHLRLEDLGSGREIIIDVFKSNIKNPSDAYVESRNFPNNETGSEEAAKFLEKYHMSYKIIPRS